MDREWDMKGFGFLDPTGENSMNREREVKLTNLQFIEQRLLNFNGTFSKCQSFLYACLAHIESLQLTSRINMSAHEHSWVDIPVLQILTVWEPILSILYLQQVPKYATKEETF